MTVSRRTGASTRAAARKIYAVVGGQQRDAGERRVSRHVELSRISTGTQRPGEHCKKAPLRSSASTAGSGRWRKPGPLGDFRSLLSARRLITINRCGASAALSRNGISHLMRNGSAIRHSSSLAPGSAREPRLSSSGRWTDRGAASLQRTPHHSPVPYPKKGTLSRCGALYD